MISNLNNDPKIIKNLYLGSFFINITKSWHKLYRIENLIILLKDQMNKILIIDRDSTTLNDISRLIVALKFEPLVAFNTASLSGIIRSEIAAIFIDVETKWFEWMKLYVFLTIPKK